MSAMFDDLPPQVPGLDMKHYIDAAGIPRAQRDDRPIIRTPCPDRWGHDPEPMAWCVDGRVPGARPGTRKICPTCKGKGETWKAFTRTTTFIDPLDEKTNVHKWRIRMLLRGIARSPIFATGQLEAVDWDTLEQQETKRYLNDLADRLMMAGGVEESADRGTHLHELTALVDTGQPLPDHTWVPTKQLRIPVTLQDRADVAAWRRVVDELGIEFTAVERFVVQDELSVAGTLDRRAKWPGRSPCNQCDLPSVWDLKTGSVEYGGGKMPQQLAIYARSQEYDPETGERTHQDVCTHRGLIVNLVAGTGDAKCYVADLEAGWESVQLSKAVRAHRTESRAHLWPYEGVRQ